MADGVKTHVSRECGKGMRMRMSSARTMAASVLGRGDGWYGVD